MLGLLLIWFGFVAGYIGNIIWPTNLDRCSNKTIKKQEIKEDSKLNLIYLNKGTYPRLKAVAYYIIIHFVSNIIITIFLIVLYFFKIDLKILDLISFIYFMFFLICGTIMIILLNFKK